MLDPLFEIACAWKLSPASTFKLLFTHNAPSIISHIVYTTTPNPPPYLPR